MVSEVNFHSKRNWAREPAEFETLCKLIRETTEFLSWDRTGHGMYGSALNAYLQFLQDKTANRVVSLQASGPYSEEIGIIELAHDSAEFSPHGLVDGRERALRMVVQRRGQPKFRQDLINSYEGCCAITGCPVLALLEAAHITPYLGAQTNLISNGLLLRADLHTLWDLSLIAAEPSTGSLWVSPVILDETYRSLEGTLLFVPTDPAQRPAIAALEQQWHQALRALSDAQGWKP